MKKPRPAPKKLSAAEFGSPAFVEAFRKHAAEFNAQYSTKESALALLVREGILTPKGKLTKNYSIK